MTLEPAQIFQLVSLLAVLALFGFSARESIDYRRWFRKWEADRKARRDAELEAEAREHGDDDASSGPAKGPWG